MRKSVYRPEKTVATMTMTSRNAECEKRRLSIKAKCLVQFVTVAAATAAADNDDMLSSKLYAHASTCCATARS